MATEIINGTFEAVLRPRPAVAPVQEGEDNVFTTVRGTLSTESSDGTYDGYGGHVDFICGTSRITGGIGTVFDGGKDRRRRRGFAHVFFD